MRKKLTFSNKFRFFGGWGYHIFYFEKGKGKLMGCGRNDRGQLGLGDKKSRSVPEVVKKFFDGNECVVKSVSLGWPHTLYLDFDGVAYASGGNFLGMAGTSTKKNVDSDEEECILLPTPVIFATASKKLKVKQVSAGGLASYHLSIDGDVYSHGMGRYGRLGLGGTENVRTAQKIIHLKEKIVEVIAGCSSVMLVSVDGNIFCCGYNEFGEFGIENTDHQLVPVEITWFKKQGLKVDKIACSTYNYFFICGNRVYTVGKGTYGQRGNGTLDSCSTPELSTTIKDVEEIKGGECFTHILKSGKVYHCGFGDWGQVKDQNFYDLNYEMNVLLPTPYKINDKKIVQIVRMWLCALFITEDASFYGIGSNTFGQFMNGTMESSDKLILTKRNLDVMKSVSYQFFKSKEERLDYLLKLFPTIYDICVLLTGERV